MPEWNTGELIAADKRFVWHPFTDMREWCAPEHERLVLVEGRGALLRDSNGREYIDGNSIDLDKHPWPQSPAHQRGYPPSAQPRGAHFISRLYEPRGYRIRAGDRGSFPGHAVDQSFFLR